MMFSDDMMIEFDMEDMVTLIPSTRSTKQEGMMGKTMLMEATS